MSGPMNTYDLDLSRELNKLNRMLANPQTAPAELAKQTVLLAGKNLVDDPQVTAALQNSIVAISRADRTLAGLTAVDAANESESGSTAAGALQISWVHLLSPPTLAERAQLFPLVEESFRRAKDENFKAVIGEKVLELSAYACTSDDGMKKAHQALSAVQAFAFSAENLPLANGAGKQLSELNTALRSGPVVR